MIHDIVNIIKAEISTLSFIDKIGGIVKPLKIKKVLKDSTIEKIIPVCYNTNKTTCNVSDYLDYCPNTTYKSVSYFEVNEIRELDSTTTYTTFEATVRFTCWLNLPLINQTINPINNIPFEILGVVGKKISNSSPFVFAQITGENIVKNEDIFSPYTYDEAENQYLMFPFDFFAVDFTIQFRVPYACITNVTLNPATCL